MIGIRGKTLFGFARRWGAATIGTGAAIFGILILYKYDCQSPTVVEFLYRFQTAFAGFAATLAAYLTVRQMTATDDRAQRRHEQLFGAELRRDRLLLQFVEYRLEDAAPTFEYYERTFSDYAFYTDAYLRLRSYENSGPEAQTALENALQARKALEGIFRNIRETFQADKFRVATDLFGPKLISIQEDFENLLLVFPAWRRQHVHFINFITGPDIDQLMQLDPEDIRASLNAVETHTKLLIGTYAGLRLGIRSLLSKYPALID